LRCSTGVDEQFLKNTKKEGEYQATNILKQKEEKN
jgi:hypothetical protein